MIFVGATTGNARGACRVHWPKSPELRRQDQSVEPHVRRDPAYMARHHRHQQSAPPAGGPPRARIG